MTYLYPTIQRLSDTGNLMFWLVRHHRQQAKTAPERKRLFTKRQRDDFMLVLRAQWYGFDRNETLYLLKLFDEKYGNAEEQKA
ncbi:hypothetical protein BC777_3474 [Yoonia maricola]|uniref:Uncharacterized protein n=1 Tax=Yoonia maricola TaxID=420999 RepID=A0A2M8W0G9_9RHOB|nr:hypothetical protein [Yoonia maricola]PJI84416.1 hypothetical protein BC777_3474 [Yoonia maricola]